MTKKAIIEKLRTMGYKANYQNVLFTPYERGYVYVMVAGRDIVKVTTKELGE